MTSIRSFSEILLQAPGLERDQSERFLRIIHDESIRMTRLLDDILELSVLEGGHSSWALRPIDPDVALANAVSICRGLSSSAQLELVRTPREKGDCVMADPDRLSQVFINLISNAIRHNNAPQPRVRIASVLREDAYELTVEDNGPGIPPEVQERLFSKFSRGGGQRLPGVQGAGLGLAISWQIVRRLGGTLELVPGRGPGACFRLHLQRISQPAGAAQPATPAGAWSK